jgi:hypothetical protein
MKGTRAQGARHKEEITAFLITTPVGASSACDKRIARSFFNFRHLNSLRKARCWKGDLNRG